MMRKTLLVSMTLNNYLRAKGVPNVSFLKDAPASDDRIKAEDIQT